MLAMMRTHGRAVASSTVEGRIKGWRSVTSVCRASRSGENQKPLQTSSLYFGIKVSFECIHAALLQPRQVNRRHHAAGAPATKFNRRYFKLHEPCVAGQSFTLFASQRFSCAAG